MTQRAAALAIVLAVYVASHDAAASRAASDWRREPEMAAARAAHAVAATAAAIYVMGGTGADGQPVTGVERFDGQRWSIETRLPGEGLNAPAAAAIGGRIYLIGGFGATTNRPVAAVHAYDTKARQWREAAPLPAPRGGHAAVVVDGRIHALGGGNSVSTLADHSVYDPATNAWIERAKLPRSMGSVAGAVFDGKLWSIGGRSGPGDFGDVYVYDAAADTWKPGVAIPARGTGGAAAIGGTLYYFGGESQATSSVLGDVLRFDPRARAWVADAPLPTPRNFARAVVFKGRVYVIGGSTGYGRSHASVGSRTVESFRP